MADERPWHILTQDDVLAELKSAPQGLSEAEARKRLALYGTNRLPAPPRRGAALRFALQFHNILIYVLLGSAAVTAYMRHWIDTLVILAVVIVNAVIGFIQEGKAEKAMDAIRYMLAPRATLLRDGERRSVPGESVAPGDVALLEAGDKVPADMRLIQANGLLMQEAILTGESVPTEKCTDAVSKDASLGDRACMAFSGTLVAAGQGRGVVTATGAKTEIGRISGLLAEVETLTTPLVMQMDAFAKWLTLFILLVAGLLLAFGYFVGHHDFTEMFMAVVGLAVAAIPEGLPAVLTITLAIGVQSMARRNAIVRRLPAIETLGSVSVICTDKTGTLTRNEMMVASVVIDGRRFTVDGDGYAPHGRIREDGADGGERIRDSCHALREMACAITLCNDANLHEEKGAWTVEGDPMEGALLAFAGKVGVDARTERGAWTRADVIPFDAKLRFMATLERDCEGRGRVFVKGAPEQVLEMCGNQRSVSDDVAPLDEAYWRRESERIALLGQRVLAVAVKTSVTKDETLRVGVGPRSLTLLGVLGMIDPPRPEAIDAVAECAAAGVRVKMITGDHAKTAMAIGKRIGLQNCGVALTGADIDLMDVADLKEAVLTCDIFARTSPEHKLRLVTALQSHGLTVAMTGDGVNDAPALRRADAGIAMGKKGSEAAKEAAELVLADDNFASIVAAVREGRTVYHNIKKVIGWTLPTNGGEAVTIIVALLFGMTLPITPIQILWINLITAVTLGVTLAFDPTEEAAMQRPPRPRHEPILTGALAWQVTLVSLLFFCGVFGVYSYAVDRGYSLELARTLALNVIVTMEVFYLFFVRTMSDAKITWKSLRGTKAMWMAIGVVAAAQFAITYLSSLQAIFATRPMSLGDVAVIIGVGLALFALVEVEKQIRLRISPPPDAARFIAETRRA